MRTSWIAVTLALLLLGSLAPLAGAQVTITGGVGNVTPVITSVTVGSSFSPTSGTTTDIPIIAVITDTNGCNDLNTGSASVTASIIKPDGSTVHVAASSSIYSSCAVGGIAATFTKTLTMNYYDAAATAGSTYKVKIVAVDQAGATVNNVASFTTFSYASLVAMSAPSTFSFGSSVSPGVATAAGVGIAITNAGNSQIDTQVSSTALTLSSPAATIPVSALTYSLSSNMASPATMTGSSVTISTFDLTAGVSSAKTVYLQLTVPAASDSQYIPAGSYTGTVTVTAVSG